MKDESPHNVGASERSGGTSSSHRIADPTGKYVPHDCIESDLIWMLLAGKWPPPKTLAWAHISFLVAALVQRKLAAIRPVLAHSGMWDSLPNRYDDMRRFRDTYDKPPKTAAQIKAEVRHSWAKVEREIAARWSK